MADVALRLRDRITLSADQNMLLGVPFFQARRTLKAMAVVSPRLLQALSSRRPPSPHELRELFESLGVTYIKLGQFIGSSSSFFPKEYVEAFQDCFDKTAPLDFGMMQSVVETELGTRIDEVFSWIDPKPLASASIAQVHAATLKTGESVVIKIQKPGVNATISADLNVLLLVTRLLERFTPNLNRQMLSGFVEAIYPYMMDECDFTKEANYLLEFERFLTDNHITSVVAPRPFVEFSSRKILVMERLIGESFIDIVRDQASCQINSATFQQAVMAARQTWFASLTGHWFFHADLHLGNLMLLNDGKVGFIDFGLVGSVGEKTWKASFQLFEGISQGNSQLIAGALIDVGMTQRQINRFAFENDIEALIERFKGLEDYDPFLPNMAADGAGDSFMEDANRWLMELASLSRQYGIVFPHAFTLLLKQFIYFDRLASLTPDDDVLGDQIDQLLEDFRGLS